NPDLLLTQKQTNCLESIVEKESDEIVESSTTPSPQLFKAIKTALTPTPFLRYPVYDDLATFIIQTDTSSMAVRALLYQENATDKWTIAYSSQRLIKPEKHCLAFIYYAQSLSSLASDNFV
uniref:Reverse transcriptase/retrotransposon-derived protein RNase H-like domain-containing protein n=1 Tax=Romanomermis culicivorax TaxID=13658 RepID=A0A915HT06_ROMCU